MGIAENIGRLRGEIPSSVAILAACKGRSIAEARGAYEAHITLFGENYVREAEKKWSALKGKVELHLIGHCQKNKVKKAVELFDMIQTVDSEAIAKEIDKQAGERGKVMPVLIEVNIAEEKGKSGCGVSEVIPLSKFILALKNLDLKGLMAMGPEGDAEEMRPYFREAYHLFLKMKEFAQVEILSMGMSDSFQVAIEEGATMVRIGKGIFG